MTKALPSVLLYRSEHLCWRRILQCWLVVFGSLGHNNILGGNVPSLVVSTAAAETVSSSVLITQALQSSQELLERSKSQPSSSSTATATSPDSYWPEQLQTIQQAVDRYSTLRQERDALIQQVNVRQIQQLIEKLQTIREVVTEQKSASAASSAANQTITNTSDDDRWWKDQLDPTVVLKPAEAALEAWIETLMWQELEQFQQQQQQLSLAPSDSPQQEHQCLTASVAVTQLQTALNQFAQDGIGRDDLFQQPGTVIVHELTSSTYQPPFADTAAVAAASSQPSWYHKWIPQDWEEAWMWLRREHAVMADTLERLFQPQSWPDHLYHTLRITSSPSSAPPETVLQKSLWPGACWPVAMNTKSASRNGNSHTHNKNNQHKENNPAITVRLATPRVVTALSLDHVSGHLVEDRSTAPQRVRVYGYAPCTSNNHCDGRGFDINSKFILANELVYDLDGSFNIQTFPLGTASPHPEDADQQDDTAGSCAASAGEAACGASPTRSIKVAAVTVEILSNHGHPDYTCLYRVRIHANDDADDDTY